MPPHKTPYPHSNPVSSLLKLSSNLKRQLQHLCRLQNPTQTPVVRVSLTQIWSDWKKSVEGQWSSVQEEWASEREQLVSAWEEWENTRCKVRVGISGSYCAAPPQQTQLLLGGLGNGDIVKVFRDSERAGSSRLPNREV